MPTLITPNGKLAEATTPGELKLVLTTARLARKDQTNVYYYISRAPSRPH